MIVLLFHICFSLVSVVLFFSFVDFIFDSYLPGYYDSILSLIVPSINSIIPYLMDYSTALFLADSIILMISLYCVIFVFNFVHK